MATIKSGNTTTTYNKDGTKSTTITNPNGRSSTTYNSDGSITTTIYNSNGQVASSNTFGGSSSSSKASSSGNSSGSGSPSYNPNPMPENYGGSVTASGNLTSQQQALINQMNQNSISWYTDPTNQKSYEQQNQSIAQQLTSMGVSVGYDSDAGRWTVTGLNNQRVASGGGGFSYESAPSYTDKYSAQIEELLNGILNRDSFSYNALDDPLYQQYREQYQREGQRAMQDTYGQQAARTGGLGSSWAQSAAQQANNYYTSMAADKIPELYQLAYEMYLDEVEGKVRDLGLLENLSDTQYNRYRDTMSDWRDDRNFAYGVYRDDVSDGRYDDELSYSRSQDASSSRDSALANILSMLGSGYSVSSIPSYLLEEAEITEDQATALASDAAAQLAASSRSSGSGSSRSTSSDESEVVVEDYDGLYANAYASSNPQNYIASHYKEFGFTSSTGLWQGYQNWTQGLYGDYDARLYGDSSNFETLVSYSRKVYERNGNDADYLYDVLKKQGYNDSVIDLVFSRLGL